MCVNVCKCMHTRDERVRGRKRNSFFSLTTTTYGRKSTYGRRKRERRPAGKKFAGRKSPIRRPVQQVVHATEAATAAATLGTSFNNELLRDLRNKCMNFCAGNSVSLPEESATLSSNKCCEIHKHTKRLKEQYAYVQLNTQK